MKRGVNWNTVITSIVVMFCTGILSYFGNRITTQLDKISVLEEKVRVLELRQGWLEDHVYKVSKP